MLVKEFPKKERPINRVCEVGAGSVSAVELLASLLQTGNALEQAAALIAKFGNLSGLINAEIAAITAIKGIGRAQAARIKAALELGRRAFTDVPEEKPQIQSPGNAAALLMPTLGASPQELFVVMYLDTRNRVIEQETLYKGTLNTSVVRIAEVFRGAMARNCANIIVAHNHPSGDPAPSPEDIALTRRLVEVGKKIEIELMDHLIIGKGRYVSLRERCLGFEEA